MNKIYKVILFFFFLILTIVVNTNNIPGHCCEGMTNNAAEANHNLNKDKNFFSLIEYPVGALIQRKTF